MEYPVKLFISHAHKDQRIAKLLVDYLSSEYALNKREIRCTSVADNDLPLGEFVAEQLRKDVTQEIGFIALLTHFGLDSVWVRFELGAAWVTRQAILPILGPKIEADDARLGPVNFMPFLMINDPQCEHKLEEYFGRIAKDLKIERKQEVSNTDKLNLFIDTFRQFGGAIADFSGTNATILSPQNDSVVKRVITVRMNLKGVPEDGYIWVGVLNTQVNLIWPKESLEDSHSEGERSIEINENGTPEPGTLAIVIIGVGAAGNEILKDWRRRSEKTGSWGGIKSSDILGYHELACVKQLTLLR